MPPKEADTSDDTDGAVPLSDSAAKSSPHLHSSFSSHRHAQQVPVVPRPIGDDDGRHLAGILFVVGDALLDIYAEVTSEFIDNHHLQLDRSFVATDQHKGQLTSLNKKLNIILSNTIKCDQLVVTNVVTRPISSSMIVSIRRKGIGRRETSDT